MSKFFDNSFGKAIKNSYFRRHKLLKLRNKEIKGKTSEITGYKNGF
jgi:hypothetical protein